jgi:hypothetical protein
MANYGFSALNNNLNANSNNGFNVANAISQANLIRAVRVLSIVLDETHPRFKELGEWNALGIVEYEDVINPLPSPSLQTARPLTGNFKNLPLVNEIVYLIGLPNTDIASISSNSTEYYINIVSLWNHPHHNAFPTSPNSLPPTQQKDYIQTQAGNVRRVTDQSTEIFLGKTFIERSNIHPLLPFEGDMLYEGRWGNSIRIGSTVKDTPNNWSTVGTNGDPILIIRNGQGIQTEEGWVPTVEDINNDDSSIYVASTQKIPLKASSTIYDSYRTSPTAPDQYSGKQVILNSGRLVFNTTQDHLLLSSNQTIGFNAVSGFNFDTKGNFVVGSPSIKLGSKNATEPLLLGNKTTDLLSKLVINLKAWMTIASPLFASTPGGVAGLPTITSQLVSILSELETNLNQGTIKSKNNFTV